MTEFSVPTARARAKEVLRVLECSAEIDYIGEPISQLEHGLQAASYALSSGQDDDVVLSCLLHDIGHLINPSAPQMDGLGVIDHEVLGGDYLASMGFSPVVAHLVRSHVLAKRYLCYRKTSYYNRLSDASRETLEWQGGPLDHFEAERFEADPWFEVILRMRLYDEQAKEPEALVPPLSAYRMLMIRHLEKASRLGAATCLA